LLMPWVVRMNLGNELATTDEDERMADQVERHWDYDPMERSSYSTRAGLRPAKLWPDEYFSELANRVVKELDHDVLILCGPLERERRKDCKHGRESKSVQPGGTETFSWFEQSPGARSRLLVTTDSGPRHFAAAFEIH